MSVAHEMGLLLGVIPALFDAAIRLADHVERLTLPDGQIVVTVAGRPAFRSPADAFAVAERCADDLRMICEQAGHGAAGGVPVDHLGTFCPFTVESCAAIKAELARVQALAMQARRGSEEAAA
ncbi:MAG TPA: hypothetical protein VH877_18675 [Polyangia bacterium]|jgi:hypothetical protein|nr:hypothetical protein [Polyangia bacterium]